MSHTNTNTHTQTHTYIHKLHTQATHTHLHTQTSYTPTHTHLHKQATHTHLHTHIHAHTPTYTNKLHTNTMYTHTPTYTNKLHTQATHTHTYTHPHQHASDIVRQWVQRNGRGATTKEPDISQTATVRTAKDDSGLKALRIQRRQVIQAPAKQKQLGRGRKMLEETSSAGSIVVIWSDEKFFRS